MVIILRGEMAGVEDAKQKPFDLRFGCIGASPHPQAFYHWSRRTNVLVRSSCSGGSRAARPRGAHEISPIMEERC